MNPSMAVYDRAVRFLRAKGHNVDAPQGTFVYVDGERVLLEDLPDFVSARYKLEWFEEENAFIGVRPAGESTQ